MAEALCRTSLGWSFEFAVLLALLVPIACGFWLFAAGQRLLPGPGRLAAAAPVVAINLLLPRLFCPYIDVNTLILVTFNTFWISTFKALSWAFNRGALCVQRFTPTQFVAVYATPVTPVISHGAAASATASGPSASLAPAPSRGGSSSTTQPSPPGGAAWAASGSSASLASSLTSSSGAGAGAGAGAGSAGALPHRGGRGRLGEDAGGSRKMLQVHLGKSLLVGVVAWLLTLRLPGVVESFALALALYSLLSAIMDGPAALIIGLTGLRVSPHFDQPWLSTSVATFWSRRWDLAAGNTLRQLVYDSVVDGSLLPPPMGAARSKPTAVRQALATAATFAVSGVVHEAFFWYFTGHTTHGVWFAFFFIQAPIIMAERTTLALLKQRGILVPAWLRTAVTVFLVSLTGQHLFWPPTKRYGVMQAALSNTREAYRSALHRVGLALPL